MINEVILVQTSGEFQFIGILTEETEEGIRLANPLRVVVEYREPNTPTVLFYPWDELTDADNVYLDKLHVVYYTVPKDSILKYYKDYFNKVPKSMTSDTVSTMTEESLTAMIERFTNNDTLH
jgi:hypothetical protein